jgi:hypothetical protein
MDSDIIKSVLPEGTVFEMILATVDTSGKPNAAPVGVRREGNDLILELAEDTTSASNLLATRHANLYLIRDPLVFAKAAFNLSPRSVLSNERFEGISGVCGAAAAISTRLLRSHTHEREDELGTTAFLHVVLEPTQARLTGVPMPHSRSYSAAIEAIIHTTRAQIARERKLEGAFHDFSRRTRREIETARSMGTDRGTEESLGLCLQRLDNAEGGEDDEE